MDLEVVNNRMLKLCLICKIEKSKDDFHKNSSYCKPCKRIWYKDWYKKNEHIQKLKRKEGRKKWETKEIRKRRKLIHRYGITLEKYNEMLQEQNGVCKICKMTCARFNNLCIDHCHTTGKVRGLLCESCNYLLGKAKDNPVTLREAAKYLEESWTAK